MTMYDKQIRFNFRPLGREIKRKRESMGWTQEYLAQLIDRTSHTVMYMETRGQHPSLNVFYQVVTLLDISVDRFFFPNRHSKESERRQRIDMLLDSLDERELSVIEATAEGLKKSGEIESGK